MSDARFHGAAGDASHRLAAPLGGEQRKRLGLVAVDHPDRCSTFCTLPIRPVYARVDPRPAAAREPDHLPIVLLDGMARETARFRHLSDAAHFLRRSPDEPATLPYAIAIAARGDDGEQLQLGLDAGKA